MKAQQLQLLTLSDYTPAADLYTQRPMKAHHLIIDHVLGTNGKGLQLMKTWNNIPQLLQNLDAAQLTNRQRAKIRAALALNSIREEQPAINSPADAADLLQDIQHEPRELLIVFCLNRRNHVTHRETIYQGSANSSQVRIAEVFRPAIIRNSSALIVAHNHPSGDPSPSPDDVAVTRAIVQAGTLLDIEVLDHLIIGLDKWVSLKERGLGFS